MVNTKSSPASEYFEAFRRSAASTDRVVRSGEAYEPAYKAFQKLSPQELKARQKRLVRAIDELGFYQFAGLPESIEAKLEPWKLDPFPVVLRPDEWRHLAEGVVQRALAFNAYAADMYGAQQILKERVIPHEVALGDPAFIRPLCGLPVPNNEYSQFGAFDLVQAADGEWQVLEHHMGMPFGMSQVLQNRRLLSEIYPEVYEHLDAAPVDGFSTYLLEMLRAQSSQSNPHIVLLTNSRQGQAYFEEASIARRMGLSVAQPGDLLVRESRVYLKTIRGLEPIDVIYRRIESAALDPITVPNHTAYGVPGLINVLRKGNVSIVNAPGVGVADNRALLRYADRITRYYLGQPLTLKSVPTFNLIDIDQRAQAMDLSDDLVIKPVQDQDLLWEKCGRAQPGGSPAQLDRIARAYPRYFVAQSIPRSIQIPHYQNGHFHGQNVFLRLFYIIGAQPVVLCGGFARNWSPMHRTRRLSIVSDTLKDICVPDQAVVESEPKRPPMQTGARFSIGSRVAESLYWAGRYLERAENTARQFNTLEKARWDQMPRAERHAYWPLLRAVAAASGQTKLAKRKRPPRDTLQFSNSLLLDASKGASVRACVRFARNSLENVREMISPECWEVLEEVTLYLNQQAKERTTRTRLHELSEMIVSEVARFNGTAERTMLHDDSWQFYRMGMFFERAMGLVSLLEVALPSIVETYHEQDEENIALTALLRLVGSLDAYRREFRSRVYLGRITRLLMQGKSNPSSLNFCLLNLQYVIGTLSITGEKEVGQGIINDLHDLIQGLDAISLTQVRAADRNRIDIDEASLNIPTSSEQIEAEFAALSKKLQHLHERIEDRFFSHQESFARDPMLFDV
ncbi:MAG: circularly permuted type 2 ATP-grasp protein [Verrucomicrobiota bacterium]